jgi:hypothetical protein
MPLSIAKKVISKYGNMPISWFNWGEPLLYNELPALSKMVQGTKSMLSSNISHKLSDEKIEAIQHFAEIFVSISGVTAETYGIYHRGGNFKLVMENLRRLAPLRGVMVTVKWLDHPQNQHERAACEAMCRELGVGFGSGDLCCEVENLVEGFDHPLLKDPKFPYQTLEQCSLRRMITIGVDGTYQLCCASHNVLTGYTIDDDISVDELDRVKAELPLCKLCHERKFWRMY